jgi:hypothetical protein
MFTPDQFTPTHFHSSEDKTKFANQFVKFVNSAFAEEHFPKWFYQELSNTFGHIAHYNQGGFYATFFTCPADALEFINQCLDYPCYGQPEYTYCDVEKVLQSWMIENKIREKWFDLAIDATEKVERAELNRLQEKYGIG